MLFGIIFIPVIFLTNNTYAGHTYGSDDVVVTYDHCAGTVTVKFLAYYDVNGTPDDDEFPDDGGAGALSIKVGNLPAKNIGFFKEHDSHGQVHSSPNGETQCYGYNNYSANQTVEAIHDGGYFYWKVTFKLLPPFDAQFGQNVIFRVTGKWDGSTPVDISKSITTSKVNSPSNLTATNNTECDKVQLSWSSPSISCLSGNYEHQIYRDGTLLATQPYSISSYSDATASKGTQYDYQVRTRLFTGESTYNNSNLSTSVIGKRIGLLLPPTNILASDNTCDGKINLSWDWNSTNPRKFRYQWNTASDFSGTDHRVEIAGDKRSFVHTPTSTETAYYFRMDVKNECDEWSVGWSNSDGGIAPYEPLPPTNVNATSSTAGVAVTWTDNSSNETGFIVERSQFGGGGTSFFDVAINATSYQDNDALTCQKYSYKVRSKNGCMELGVPSISSDSSMITPDLSTTFSATKKLKCSKGYFINSIQLEWSNNNITDIEDFKIYRKIYGSNNDSTLITSVNSSTALYLDLTTEPGVYYQYFIHAETNCSGTLISSNSSSDIGFRSPTGIVNGHIDYTGGIAVKGAKVLVTKTTGSTGSSLLFDGTNDYASIGHSSNLMPTTSLTLEAWVRPGLIKTNNFIFSKGTAYELYLDNKQPVFKLNNGALNLKFAVDTFELNQYQHIAATYDGITAKIFVNGELKQSQAYTTPITANTAPLLIAANSTTTSFFNGNIDELRVWKRARTEAEIQRDYQRILNGNETGVVASLGLDENVGEFIFDRSKDGVNFNENHGFLINETSWSSTIPTPSQLGYLGITDAGGDYTIAGIRYAFAGENFKLTPVHGTHEFSPSSRVVFIGSGANIHNNQDFEDISAFEVTGKVKFAQTTCASRDVTLNIDGEPIIKNGQIVKTDPDGNFSIMVPIGEHFITVTKPGHEFSAGRYPPLPKVFEDFQEPVYNIEFRDTTIRKVVGKVVGGLEQQNNSQVPGFCKNNIGMATVLFRTQNRCDSTSVSTADTSGQYTVTLLPLKYEVPNFSITSNPIVKFEDNDLLNLSTNLPLQTEHDTLFIEGTSIVKHSDSIKFHKELDFIHRSRPDLKITDTLNLAFRGEDSLQWVSNNKADTISINLQSTPFEFPIFKHLKIYSSKISVFEEYKNKDAVNWVLDTVPVTEGKLTITNDLALQGEQNTVIELNQADGDTIYTFRCGEPNTTENGATGEENLSFTKTFEVTLKTSAHEVNWQPSTVADGEIFRAIILGSLSSADQSFITNGPDVVDFIIRDPPGSNSFAFREEGTSTTTYSSYELGNTHSASFSKKIFLGTAFTVGLGMQIKTKIKNNVSINTTTSASVTGGGEYKEVTTTNERWQTSADPFNVGAASDLFVGSAKNVNFGVSTNLELVKKETCDLGIACHDGEIVIGTDTVKIARRKGFQMAPEGYGTGFIYDKNHIENYLIPNLEMLRNQYFVKYPSIYQTTLSSEDDKYGTNNDDLVWGASVSSSDPIYSQASDSTGISYTFYKSLGGTDSIRIFNQQIRLWKRALKRNEKEKLDSKYSKNRSFNAGPTYSLTHTTDIAKSNTISWELNLSSQAQLDIGANVGGSGVEVGLGVGVDYSAGGSRGKEVVKTTTYGYELHDPDIGDFFSVDILDPVDGNGPIFNLIAGQSSCPHEPSIYTEYHTPLGTKIAGGTLIREVPRISVAPAIKINIPADQQADFALTLGNDSESGDDNYYKLSVIQSTNPFGAIIKVDGTAPTREIIVGAGSSVQKILTIEKGPGDIYDYDNIGIIFTSPCQFEGGTGDDIDIADTCWVSAHFIPTCSDIEIITPDNQWVVNKSFNDTLNTVLAEYDINFPGLEEVKFWYKPSSQSSWVGLQTWHKDTTGMNSPDLEPIPTGDIFTLYPWDLLQINDGYYDIKATTKCTLADKESDIYSGIMDRINPHPFGTPSPADGILSPNDEIMIQFNEPIDLGLLNKSNFSISGVLNGTDLRHDGFLYFNGIDDNMEIANGLSINSSFSMEFWIKRDNLGLETVISQGLNEKQSVHIGFNSTDKLTFTVAEQQMLSNTVINDNKWHHVACAYDKDNGTSEIFIDGTLDNTTTVLANYIEGGKIYIGKSSITGSANRFKGYMHEFRIWNKALDLATVGERMNKQLSGKEFNLIGCWQMNEATGTITTDIARHRNAVLNGTTWVVEPSGRSQKFDVDNAIEIPSGSYAFSYETDLTIEFWFKSDSPTDTVTFFSNGRADRQGNNPNSWIIFGTTDNHIRVMNDSVVFDAVTNNYFDNSWHHFALVVSRIGNTYSYIDGNLQNTTTSSSWLGFGGAKFWLGSRGWFTGTIQSNNMYYKGFMDEVRIWNLARKQEQISRDRVNRLSGEEYGLIAYYPFEKYVDVMNILTLTQTLENIVDNTVPSIIGSPLYSTDAPTIKMERPVENIPFDFSVNNDKIIFTTTIDPYRIENTTIDITIKEVQDLQGNQISHPETWIAFIDKNQVVWQDQELAFTKEVNKGLSFQANILNTGGELKTYSIENLPLWLSTSSETGTINPNSYKTVTFDINPGVNIGSYEEAISVVTDFGYNEQLLLKLHVFSPEPEWDVNPDDYLYSMNVIGQLKIEDIISTDTADILAVFVGDECRGKAKLQYLNAYDMHEVFLDIYSNSQAGEPLSFKIWNASEGIIHTDITPEYIFQYNSIKGTPAAPIMFTTKDSYSFETELVNGWKWVSFNLSDTTFRDVNKTFDEISAQPGDLVKGQTQFDGYNQIGGWSGSLSNTGGFKNEQMYMIKLSQVDTLSYTGSKLISADIPIQMKQNWNWIGYTPQSNISINDAFGYYTPSNGDLVKSQYSFAMYDQAMGWLGSLNFLKPGDGYMYYKTSSVTDTLIYPEVGAGNRNLQTQNTPLVEGWNLEVENYQYTMSLIAELIIPDAIVSSNHIIGAFVENECRGISEPTVINGKSHYFITIYSNTPNENIQFKVIDTSTELVRQINEELLFTPNDIIGNIELPQRLTINSTTSVSSISGSKISIYPNPTSGKVTVDLTYDSKFEKANYEITDISGKVLVSEVINIKKHTIDFETLGAGVYFIKINSGTEIFIEKIVVQ